GLPVINASIDSTVAPAVASDCIIAARIGRVGHEIVHRSEVSGGQALLGLNIHEYSPARAPAINAAGRKGVARRNKDILSSYGHGLNRLIADAADEEPAVGSRAALINETIDATQIPTSRAVATRACNQVLRVRWIKSQPTHTQGGETVHGGLPLS